MGSNQSTGVTCDIYLTSINILAKRLHFTFNPDKLTILWWNKWKIKCSNKNVPLRRANLFKNSKKKVTFLEDNVRIMVWLILNSHSTDFAFICKSVSDKSVQRPIITGWLKQTHFWCNTVVVKRAVILDYNCDHAVVGIAITMFFFCLFFCINHHYHSFQNHCDNQQKHVPHHPHSKSCWHSSHTMIYINYSYLKRLNYTWYTMEVSINSTIFCNH